MQHYLNRAIIILVSLIFLTCGSIADNPQKDNSTTNDTIEDLPVPTILRPDDYNLDLIIGETATFYLIAEYSDGSTENIEEGFTSVSDNENTATVSDATITAIQMGTAYITSNFRGVETTITVNVTPNRNIEGYRVSVDDIILSAGEKVGVNLQEVYNDGYIENISRDVTYSSSDTDIVTIFNNNIIGVSNGSTTVNINYLDNSYPINVEVSSSSNSNNRIYIFGHSLINHERNINPIPSDETSVPHWMYELSKEADEVFTANGQYGFLRTHDNLPPDSQWGFDRVPGGWREYWDSDESFADADFDSVLLTAGNFIQSNNPDENYDSGEEISPLEATESIFDWVIQQEPNINMYIYENWETMSRASVSTFPPTSEQLVTYHNNNSFSATDDGDFHKWWLDYQDLLLNSFDDVKMIPVGPILSHLFSGILKDIPVEMLYEDESPHGRTTTYFLAAVITYMAMNEKNVIDSYVIPDEVHTLVSDNFDQITTTIWSDLSNFNFEDGNSRVFFD